MKKAKKITSILITATITMVMFVGCGTKTTATTATNTTSTTSNRKNYSSGMKTTYTTVLKALVTDKTITQAQSDKVLAVVAKAMPTGGTRPSGTAKEGGAKPTGTKQSGGQHTGNRGSNNQLASLVTSKVITQAQATTINTKVQAAMKSMQSNKTN